VPRRIRFSRGNPSLVAALFDGAPHYSMDRGGLWAPFPGVEEFLVSDVVWDPRDAGTLYFCGQSTEANYPVILKSVDGGMNWNGLMLFFLGENTVRSIAVNPHDPSRLVAGCRGSIVLSTDAAASWQAASRPERFNFVAAAWDTRDSNLAFAGGGDIPPNTAGIFTSTDRGETWDETPAPQLETLQDGMTTAAYPGSLIFSTGGLENSGLASGVYRFGPPAGPMAAPLASAAPSRTWFDGEGFHIAADRPIGWRLYDVYGRCVRSGSAARATIRLDGLAHGSYWMATQHGQMVRGTH
jgi:hypothetical protein